jgi:hypothetical protein
MGPPKAQMRFDPIWRRIKPDSFTSKLEGRFANRLARLDELNNWGVLAWLYPHASATKLAHHYGLEHNAMPTACHRSVQANGPSSYTGGYQRGQ